MLRALRHLLLTVLVLLGVSAVLPVQAGQPVSRKTENVVVLVIDGPRQSEMWADPSRYWIPHLSGELAPQGVLLSGFRNNGPTYTAAGHTALCTGVYQDIENSKGSQLPSHASMFQHFLKATGLPKQKAWLITSKDKLALLGNTDEAGWHDAFTPMVWSGVGGKGFGAGYADDADTVAKVKAVLSTEHPRLMLINFKHPDAGGHSGVWRNYVEHLRICDAYAAEIWQTIQGDPALKNRTALFITHDHGRHLDGVADGFRNHGCNCEGCRCVALLALGPDFKRGAVIPKGGELIDLPVTIANMLGFSLPGVQGRVLKELFP